ncbi:MAG: FlgD immunoglobulin-like domain containing protein, partial [Candidatus Eisenbacteria bacterium]
RLPLGVADARARSEIGFVAARDRALGGTTVIVPLPGPDGTIDHRLAHRVRHRTADPPALWVSWIDAVTGETLGRENELRYALSGTVRGEIHPATPTDPFELRPFRDEVVGYSADSAYTAPAGGYVLPNGIPNDILKTALRGRFLEVVHFALPEAAQTASAPAGGMVDFTWTTANSDTAERDTYYHAHVAHDRVKAIDPAFTGLDYRMPCTVNIGNQCNAYWDGVGMNFYRWGVRPSDGRACANTGSIADVIHHEYGHGRTQQVFAPFSPSGAMHEGFSDYFAATVTDQPLVGRGFFGPGTSIRTAANTQRVDFAGCAGEVHCVGNAISGALWDLRGRLVAAAGVPADGVRLADSLFHYAGYGGAEWHDDYLLDLLVVDDDDGTLLNGTPHFADICAAFTPRGFACPEIATGVWFVHTPLPDADLGAGAFSVNATIGSFAGAFDAASPVLSWRVNGGLLHDVTMTALGGGQYRAQIPPMPAGGNVEYSLRARDFGAGLAYSPAGAPAVLHPFHVGTLATFWADDFQADRGWTSAIEGAVTGRWMRVDPNGTSTGGTPNTFFSPEDDHTPGAGTFCFVTHDTTAGLGSGQADVDGGCVTLTSPRIDLSSLDNARLEYWRWFVDRTRYDDTLSVAVSPDDGASWVELERVFLTAEGWQSHGVDLGLHVPLGAQFRLRLRTCDGGGGSLLEAGLDDVLITTRLFGAVAVGDVPTGDAAVGVAFLARPTPNPARPGDGAAIAFGVPANAAGRAETPLRLDVVDARGRIVRTLAAGALPPGRHVRRWDGRDDRGGRAGAGVYFVRLAMEGKAWREKLVRLD